MCFEGGKLGERKERRKEEEEVCACKNGAADFWLRGDQCTFLNDLRISGQISFSFNSGASWRSRILVAEDRRGVFACSDSRVQVLEARYIEPSQPHLC